MEVILAKTAGFCFGVKRAVDTVYKEAGKKNVYTYGPIIHNSEVVNDLKKKGVEVINSREELEALEEGTVIIRSHGVAREIYDLIHAIKITLPLHKGICNNRHCMISNHCSGLIRGKLPLR